MAGPYIRPPSMKDTAAKKRTDSLDGPVITDRHSPEEIPRLRAVNAPQPRIHPHSVLAYLGARWKLIVGTTLACGLCASVWAYFHPVTYASQALIQMRAWMPAAVPTDVPFKELTPAAIAISNRAISREMVDRLIASLGLYERMGLDPAIAGTEDRLREKVERMIHVSYQDLGVLALTAECQDARLAMDLANAMYHELVAMEHAQDMDDMQRAITYDAMLLDDVRARTGPRKDDLEGLMAELKLLRESGRSDAYDRDLRDIYIRAMAVLGAIQQTEDSLVNDTRRRELALSYINGRPSSSIQLIRPATIDKRTIPWLSVSAAIVGPMIIFALLSMVILVLWQREGAGFKAFLTGPPE